MKPQVVALLSWLFIAWSIWRESRARDGISKALWIPTLWAGALLSRPLSTWVGFGGGGGGVQSQDGSPLDRLFFLALILSALATLMNRGVDWAGVVKRNWPLLLAYGYLLVSVIWADSSIVSFKRWFKDFGNIIVALVVLTEANPYQAIRAVFVRCAYALIPLSLLFIRYFPELGRRYNVHSGQAEAVGVTFQKNSLGALVLVSGLVLAWDWIERSRSGRPCCERVDRHLPAAIFLASLYLLHLSDSKTSMLCLAVGAVLVLSLASSGMRRYLGGKGMYAAGLALFAVAIDQITGVLAAVVAAMGRDMTFTGRTEVWEVIVGLDINPLIGTGFGSFWSDPDYLSQLPEWVEYSAHNGYLEVFVDGGMVGVFFLALLVLVHASRTNRQLGASGDFAVVRFAVLVVTLVGNVSESHFFRMSPLWFLFLLSVVEAPTGSDRNERALRQRRPRSSSWGGSVPVPRRFPPRLAAKPSPSHPGSVEHGTNNRTHLSW